MPMPARALPSRHGRTLAPRSFTPVLLEHRNTRPIPHAPFAPDRIRGVMSLACDGHVATPLRADRDLEGYEVRQRYIWRQILDSTLHRLFPKLAARDHVSIAGTLSTSRRDDDRRRERKRDQRNLVSSQAGRRHTFPFTS